MSTRATYRFAPENVTFYVHYDGYEEGAAAYFDAMLKTEGRGMAMKFAKSNPFAEFATDHDDDSDCEYQYTIHRAADDHSKLYVTIRCRNSDWEWVDGGFVELSKFINKHKGDEKRQDWLYLPKFGYVTLPQACAKVTEEANRSMQCLANGQLGNASMYGMDAAIEPLRKMPQAEKAVNLYDMTAAMIDEAWKKARGA